MPVLVCVELRSLSGRLPMIIPFPKPAAAKDSLLPAIPSISDEPLEMLEACHGRVRAFTETLRKLVPHLAKNGADAEAAQAASNILRYFDLAAPKHHQDEEVDLFPLLLATAPEDTALAAAINQLRAEHLQMGHLWLQLRELLLLVSEGRMADLARDNLAECFADFYQQHAASEEAGVFAAAQHLLSPSQRELLGRSMAARRQDR